ncbi:M48 family metalloprotease [Amorphoplanes digitatis]|uniref:Zn-dependent protease with chaperone function n=1 Tax=Actinoplanes digitatis TaxID=1868 RepID=A0A7W7I0N9_9ACTN|nr:M48 family metalloprotease [Actinoplanes digitatis]MBB4764148.1 Zn-dependent protease with chaperone function [Actinoplanes digitatis]
MPTASLLRFLLLIAAVVATSGLAFISIYLLLPAKAAHLNDALQVCQADADLPAALATADPRKIREASRRLQSCMNPVTLDRVAFVGAGVVVLLGAATVAYLTHPWWIVRRRRLRSLTADGQAALVGDLDRLSRQIGLPRPPDWRLAPYAGTAGGQAFGLPWHRYVQIDAGLVILRATSPAEFRAVVLHELAHLRNSDVDKTYFAVGTWRAFVVVVVLPYLVLMLHPGLLIAPLEWRWEDFPFAHNPAGAAYRLGSLAALTALVYLTRNAILRERETHADATSAAVDGAGSALPSVLGRLPAPPAWRRWGTHPHPRHRLDAVRDPGRWYPAGFWELAGIGIAAGLVCANVGFLVGTTILADASLAVSAVGLVVGGPAAGLLAAAIWRTTARDPAATPTWRTWLLYPVAMVGGYLAGTFLNLREASVSGLSTSLSSSLISTSVLAIGAVFLAAWATSAARGVLRRPDPPHWAMPAIVAVTVLVGAVWFAVWLRTALLEDGFAAESGGSPAAGGQIGWYAWVTAVAGADFWPMALLVYNPFTLPGLMLMWLIPVLAGLGRPRSRPIPLGPAIVAAITCAAGLAVAVAALPYLARQVLPGRVRAADDGGVPFVTVYDNATLVLASVAVAVAVAMTVVVTRRGPYRPVLVVLTACLTTVLAAAVDTYIAGPFACYADFAGTSPPTGQCLDGMTLRLLGIRAHWIMMQALLVAVPALVAASALGALHRRYRARPPTGADGESANAAPARIGIPAGVALGLLVVAIVFLSALILPPAYRVWLEHALG